MSGTKYCVQRSTYFNFHTADLFTITSTRTIIKLSHHNIQYYKHRYLIRTSVDLVLILNGVMNVLIIQ